MKFQKKGGEEKKGESSYAILEQRGREEGGGVFLVFSIADNYSEKMKRKVLYIARNTGREEGGAPSLHSLMVEKETEWGKEKEEAEFRIPITFGRRRERGKGGW